MNRSGAASTSASIKTSAGSIAPAEPAARAWTSSPPRMPPPPASPGHPASAPPKPKKPKPMLILSRKLNESIVIDGRIIVKILRIDRDTVKLGIQAPVELPVHRQEIFDAIQRGKQQS